MPRHCFHGFYVRPQYKRSKGIGQHLPRCRLNRRKHMKNCSYPQVLWRIQRRRKTLRYLCGVKTVATVCRVHRYKRVVQRGRKNGGLGGLECFFQETCQNVGGAGRQKIY